MGYSKLYPVVYAKFPVVPLPLARDTISQKHGSQSPREREQPCAPRALMDFRSFQGPDQAWKSHSPVRGRDDTFPPPHLYVMHTM